MNEIIVMLATTTRITRQQIDRKLCALRAGGVGGIMIYARSGLEVEYMSSDWRDFCADLLLSAREHDLKVWLYDDFNWPSGSCKNTVVLENADYAAKRFVIEDNRVCVQPLPESGGEDVFNPFHTDMLNPEAIDCFIRLTHEKYYSWFAPYFGNLIEGIFTDEPSYIYTCKQAHMLPYYEGIHGDYAARWQRELEDDILDWYSGIDNGFPERFYPLICQRFQRVYFQKIGDWCRAHGIKSTGHLMNDDDLCENIRTCGDWFSCSEHLDVPGIDNIQTDVGTRFDCANAKLQTLRLEGKREAMAELFALGPCSMPFSRLTQTLWHNAAYGVNRFFFAITHFDAKGNMAKPDFFSNFSEASPNFQNFSLLAAEASRAAQFADKTPECQVAVRYPYTACLKAMSAGQQQAVAQRYRDCVQALVNYQIPWIVIRETAQSAYPVTVSMDPEGYTVEGSAERFRSMDALCDRIRCPVVILENDVRARDVFVRTYTDGSILVINRSENGMPRRLQLCREGRRAAFTMEHRGVRTLTKDFSGEDEVCLRTLPVRIDEISADRKQLLRCEFYRSDRCAIEASEPVRLRVNSRSYPSGGKVYLDGEEVPCDEPCAALTECFNSLYKTSAEMTLLPGVHQLQTELPENPHLPAVILSGSFYARGSSLSAHTPEDGRVPFFGTLTLRICFRVPKDAEEACVCLGRNELPARLEIDGETVEHKILPPFRLQIPKRLFGLELTALLHVDSSFAPIFGDLDRADRELHLRAEWVRAAAAPTPETLDLNDIQLLYR